jgi:hypothetical protein
MEDLVLVASFCHGQHDEPHDDCLNDIYVHSYGKYLD